MTDEQKTQVAAAMNLLPFVRWDRFIDWEYDEGSNGVLVYGWIDRDDGRADFVTLQFESAWGWKPDQCAATTSSAARSREIQQLLGHDAADHADCKRVDEHFGDLVRNKTSLEEVGA